VLAPTTDHRSIPTHKTAENRRVFAQRGARIEAAGHSKVTVSRCEGVDEPSTQHAETRTPSNVRLHELAHSHTAARRALETPAASYWEIGRNSSEERGRSTL
jgi:hypothetical protein